MTKRIVLTLTGALTISLATAIGAIILTGGGHRPAVAQAASNDGMMQTITPYQLSSVGVHLSTTSTTPSITPAQADSIAQNLFDNKTLETVLAQCSRIDITPQIDHPCYAISVQPPITPQLDLAGPDAAYNNSHPSPPPTFQLALIDATTGQLMAGFSSGTPPTPPSKTPTQRP